MHKLLLYLANVFAILDTSGMGQFVKRVTLTVPRVTKQTSALRVLFRELFQMQLLAVSVRQDNTSTEQVV